MLSNKDKCVNIALEKCKQYIENHNMIELPCGKHEIDGDDFYVNIVSYETRDSDKCMWEAHRHYLDIHYLIQGEETIKIANIEKMQVEEYIEDSDYVKISGDADNCIELKNGDFLVLFFEDGHMTGCRTNSSMKIKKAIFKLKARLKEAGIYEI